MLITRTLTDDDLDAAVTLAASAIPDIPMYAWILGDHAHRTEDRAWLARLFLSSHIACGTALGTVSDGRLIGVLTWVSDAHPTVYAVHQLESDRAYLAANLPIAERLLQTWRLSSESMTHPDTTAVCIEMAVVDPAHRANGVLQALLRPIEAMCREENRRYIFWTASTKLRRAFPATSPATEFRIVQLDGIDLYGFATDVAPAAAVAPTRLP